MRKECTIKSAFYGSLFVIGRPVGANDFFARADRSSRFMFFEPTPRIPW